MLCLLLGPLEVQTFLTGQKEQASQTERILKGKVEAKQKQVFVGKNQIFKFLGFYLGWAKHIYLAVKFALVLWGWSLINE